jgi:aspartate oxidase
VLLAPAVVLATGGAGRLFSHTTNPGGVTGDGIAMAGRAGARLADLEFVQFHPTAMLVGEGPQRPLVTEALRGAGAYVVDAEGRRFLFEHHSDGELAPRDVVARAIAARHSWLDCRHLDRKLLEREFPTVIQSCSSYGLDPSRDLIPVAPAAHYYVGGIQTDLDGRASIPRLYAVGECSNTGVHGANRLAGNSLAEALVFARRAARAIAGQRTGPTKAPSEPPVLQELEVPVEEAAAALRKLCSMTLGIERNAEALTQGAAALEEIARLPLTTNQQALELRAGGILARLMARSAILRTESRGVHFRSDFPHPESDWAGVRLRVARN